MGMSYKAPKFSRVTDLSIFHFFHSTLTRSSSNTYPPPPPQLPPILALIISTLSNCRRMPTLRAVAVRMPTSSPTLMH
ncbi:hypothetical protein GBA52_025393 [Prunus armeniaca]|nr:hypothetical protein GBA52_025393 [Prunus armeniaca]